MRVPQPRSDLPGRAPGEREAEARESGAAVAARRGTAAWMGWAILVTSAMFVAIALVRCGEEEDPSAGTRAEGDAKEVEGPSGAPALSGRSSIPPTARAARRPAPAATDAAPVPEAHPPAVRHDRPIPEEPEFAVETDVRLLLHGTPQAVRISEVRGGGLAGVTDVPTPHHGLRLPDESVRVRVPLEADLAIFTDDPRSALAYIAVRVPREVGPKMDVPVPDRKDPRFAVPLLEFFDSKSRKAVPGVALERSGRGQEIVPPLYADAEGHLRLDPGAVGSVHGENIGWLLSNAIFVAPGYAPLGGRMGVSQAQREAWLDTGRIPFALEPIPAEIGAVTLRLVDADGAPLTDALVVVRFPTWTGGTDLPLRPDARGLLTTPTPRVFGVSVFAQGFPGGTWFLAREGAAPGQPRELRMPALATLRVSRELGIDHSVILVSEWPGTLGFYTRNEVIAADMLTSNRLLVRRMVESRNALDVLFDEARRQGFAVQYVIYNGGRFMKPAADLSGIDLMDPKMINNVRGVVVGHAELGPPLAVRGGIVVWKVSVS